MKKNHACLASVQVSFSFWGASTSGRLDTHTFRATKRNRTATPPSARHHFSFLTDGLPLPNQQQLLQTTMAKPVAVLLLVLAFCCLVTRAFVPLAPAASRAGTQQRRFSTAALEAVKDAKSPDEFDKVSPTQVVLLPD